MQTYAGLKSVYKPANLEVFHDFMIHGFPRKKSPLDSSDKCSPLFRWLPSADLHAGQTKTHTRSIPDYPVVFIQIQYVWQDMYCNST